MNAETPALPIADGKSIALVGMMGSGKTTIGKRLAQRLHMPFVDADHEIVAAAGLSIPEIFERFGEPYFRDGERRVIARLCDGNQKIIATGGGAFMNEQTRRLLLDKALVIWLSADIETLVERVGRKADRPLLAKGDPRQILTDLLEIRNPVYAQAHVHVHSRANPHDHMVEKIMEKLA